MVTAVPERAAEALANGGFLEVVVQTIGGEEILPRDRLAADLTVGDLLRRLRRRGGPPEVVRLLLGPRQLGPEERLGDLEAADPEQGLALTVVRQGVDVEVVARLRAGVQGGELSLEARGDVGDAEVAAIAQLLRDPECEVKTLNLVRTNVADIGALAEALLVNRSLERLWLMSTGVLDIGGLAEALLVNFSLKELRLQHTGVSDISAVAEALLRASGGLAVLDLEGARVSKVGCLAVALRVSQTLGYVNLRGCPLPAHTREELGEVRREMDRQDDCGFWFTLLL